MATVALRVEADCDQLRSDLVAIAQSAELARELRELLFQGGDLPSQFRCVDVDLGAAGRAGQLRIRLEPTDRLAQLVAAARTGQIDGLRVED